MDYLTKKLLYQSHHRGCKETDLLLGKFADLYLHKMNKEEILEYAEILNQTDYDIVSWIMGHREVPKNLQTTIMQKLLNISHS